MNAQETTPNYSFSSESTPPSGSDNDSNDTLSLHQDQIDSRRQLASRQRQGKKAREQEKKKRQNPGLNPLYKKQILDDIDKKESIHKVSLSRLKKNANGLYDNVDSNQLRNYFNWLKRQATTDDLYKEIALKERAKIQKKLAAPPPSNRIQYRPRRLPTKPKPTPQQQTLATKPAPLQQTKMSTSPPRSIRGTGMDHLLSPSFASNRSQHHPDYCKCCFESRVE